MWKFIVFNIAWFLVLFAVNFPQRRFWRVSVLFLIAAWALAMVLQKAVDPFAWFFYLAFSLVAFFGGAQFKRWVYAKSMVLDEEIEEGSKQLETERGLLGRKTDATDSTNQRANEMHYLYDKIKEMSQSMDKFETFLVFGEAFSGQCCFETLALVLFNEEDEESRIPQEIYRLNYSDFEGIFDKNYILKNKKEFEIGADIFLRGIFEKIFSSRKPLTGLGDTPFAAYPILINKNISGILIVSGSDAVKSAVLPILAGRFISEIERIKLYEKVETLAVTDGLTGVYVRRHLIERLEGEISRSKKFGFNLSFLMLDVDHFKDFNDQYGHLVGDVVLRQTAETIKKNIRELDLVGRYGGEEFGVLLVETDRSGALFVAERIRTAIAEKNFKAYDENLRSTVSIGCTSLPKDRADAGLILEAADQALYEAKRQGRNRVCYNASL